MYGHLRHLTAPLLAAIALALPAAAAAAAPAHGAQETPDEPPGEPERTPEPGLPPDAFGDGVAPEPPRDAPGDGEREDEAHHGPVAPSAPGDAPPAGPGPGPTEAERGAPRDPRRGWIDVSHGMVESALFAPVVRIDRFFSDETELEVERARSFLRWRNEVRFEETGRPRFGMSVRANLRFPGVGRALRRLRLVLEGETQEAFTEAFPPEDGSPPAAAPAGSGDAELRLRIWDGLLAHADVGAGVLFETPPGAFGRLRLRWAFPVGDLFLTRVALIGFYRTDERFGASTDLHLERPVSRRVLTRLSSEVRISQESPGMEWRSELTTFVALSPRAVGAVGVGVNGASRREPVELETVRVFTRLRRDFYRRWLFLELVPEYLWPHTPGLGRHPTWAVTARLEVQFHGRARLPEPEDPEPEDPPALP